jgi:hypothetical protein
LNEKKYFHFDDTRHLPGECRVSGRRKIFFKQSDISLRFGVTKKWITLAEKEVGEIE